MSCNNCKVLNDEISYLTRRVHQLEQELKETKLKEGSMRSLVKLYQLGSIPTTIFEDTKK
jgi:hypothetical protein